jgi:hypothetical protein
MDLNLGKFLYLYGFEDLKKFDFNFVKGGRKEK